jgi:hypothetical protein
VPLSVVGGHDVATFPDSSLAAGPHTIGASYSGDTNFAISSGTLEPNQTVLEPSVTVVTSSANPSTVGQAVTFTAAVSLNPPANRVGTTPTGTVNFLDGTTQIGSGTLGSNGMTTFTTSTLAVGAHAITAVYLGDSSFAGSTSRPVTQTVNPATSTTTLVVTPNPATAGQPVTLKATVTGTPAPTGSVTFKDGTTTLGTAPLNASGVASFVTSALTAGTHSLTAVFGGNGSLSMSTSNAVSQVVSPSTAVAPTVTSTQRFGFHQQPTTLVLTFSTALSATPAQNASNYQIKTLGGPGRGGSNVGHITPVTSAVYNATAHTVTLSPSQQLDVHNRYQLTVTGTVPGGLVGSTGLPLNGSGKPGTNYVTVITRSTLAGPAPAVMVVHGLHSKVRPSAHAVDALAASGHLTVKSLRPPHRAAP